ncbi:hypothetical protein B0H14DRAFT_3425053 [Mycena olivaceomarginata]|nr:hypothetical protein B0H14DRAFT_3425053 [Mycena olivaceomarginata]
MSPSEPASPTAKCMTAPVILAACPILLLPQRLLFSSTHAWPSLSSIVEEYIDGYKFAPPTHSFPAAASLADFSVPSGTIQAPMYDRACAALVTRLDHTLGLECAYEHVSLHLPSLPLSRIAPSLPHPSRRSLLSSFSISALIRSCFPHPLHRGLVLQTQIEIGFTADECDAKALHMACPMPPAPPTPYTSPLPPLLSLHSSLLAAGHTPPPPAFPLLPSLP